jgi:hypothetical protein
MAADWDSVLMSRIPVRSSDGPLGVEDGEIELCVRQKREPLGGSRAGSLPLSMLLLVSRVAVGAAVDVAELHVGVAGKPSQHA